MIKLASLLLLKGIGMIKKGFIGFVLALVFLGTASIVSAEENDFDKLERETCSDLSPKERRRGCSNYFRIRHDGRRPQDSTKKICLRNCDTSYRTDRDKHFDCRLGCSIAHSKDK